MGLLFDLRWLLQLTFWWTVPISSQVVAPFLFRSIRANTSLWHRRGSQLVADSAGALNWRHYYYSFSFFDLNQWWMR